LNRYPDNNPKSLQGSKKVPLELVPPTAIHYCAMAMEDGARKYGPYNWRKIPVSVTPYYAAAKRHLDAFFDGEECASDSGVEHVAHAMACCAILLDAMACGVLIDDRPPPGATAKIQAEYLKNKEVQLEASNKVPNCN